MMGPRARSILERKAGLVLLGIALVLALSVWLPLQPSATPSMPRAFAAAIPARVLWAWEEPEDLRGLPPDVGVAFLAKTILLGPSMRVLPRRQPLALGDEAAVMAVVRVETRVGFLDSAPSRAALATELAAAAHLPGVRALQVDFDAAASERPFYTAVLKQLRAQMMPGQPLSMTALVSWCGRGSWLHGLPVDEAVPMYFRMGGTRGHGLAASDLYRLDEPLCRSSRGVATDEPWPPEMAKLNPATRVYLFAPQPWRPAQLAAVATEPQRPLAEEAVR